MFIKNKSIILFTLIICCFIFNVLSQEDNHDNQVNCPSNSICFYKDINFGGESFIWKASHTYKDLPRSLHNHVGSFISNNVNACFKNWVPFKEFNVIKGDNVTDFFGQNNSGFGLIIDGVSYGRCDE